MTSEELKARTQNFAKRVLKLVDALPKSIKGRAIGNQLVSSGTSTAANYRAACRARSKAEFTAKLGIVIAEADESALWLELIIEDGMLTKRQAMPLLEEANQITAIMTASRKTACNRP